MPTNLDDVINDNAENEIGIIPPLDEGGPPNPDNWTLRFEDDFASGSLDTNNWNYNWGWGSTTSWPTADIRTTSDLVWVENDALVLDHAKNYFGGTEGGGAVNTKNKVTIGPGTYHEARMKFANTPQSRSTFWSKPNDESWPPEIDVVETPIKNYGDRPIPLLNLHWGSSNESLPGHRRGFDARDDWANTYHTFGLRWLENSMTFYLDGQEQEHISNSTTMQHMNAGAPFYVMFTNLLNVQNTGEPPSDWQNFKTTMEIDWFRVWDLTGSGGGGGGGSGDGEEWVPGSSGQDRYIWFRSADGSEVGFEFGARNIEMDSSYSNYGTNADNTRAWGHTTQQANLPGFNYDAPIDFFSYSGNIEVFIDNRQIDPTTINP